MNKKSISKKEKHRNDHKYNSNKTKFDKNTKKPWYKKKQAKSYKPFIYLKKRLIQFCKRKARTSFKKNLIGFLNKRLTHKTKLIKQYLASLFLLKSRRSKRNIPLNTPKVASGIFKPSKPFLLLKPHKLFIRYRIGKRSTYSYRKTKALKAYNVKTNTFFSRTWPWWWYAFGLINFKNSFKKFLKIKKGIIFRRKRRRLKAICVRRHKRRLPPPKFKFIVFNRKDKIRKTKIRVNKLPKERYQTISNGFFPPFSLLVKHTANNIFMTALSPKKNVISNFSAGTVALYGPRRSTTFASDQIGRVAGLFLRKISFGPSLLCLQSPLTRHVSHLVKAVAKNYKKIKGICDRIPRSHNGLRPAKKRRL